MEYSNDNDHSNANDDKHNSKIIPGEASASIDNNNSALITTEQQPIPENVNNTVFVCVTGQVARLELSNKITTFFQPLRQAGYNVEIHLVLTETHFANEKNNLTSAFTTYSEALDYLASRGFPASTQAPMPHIHNMWFNPVYESQLAQKKDKKGGLRANKTERVLNHARMYASHAQCWNLWKQHQSTPPQKKYAFAIRVREDTGLSAKLDIPTIVPLLKQQAKTVLATDCRAHHGVNDRLAIVSPPAAEAYFTVPYKNYLDPTFDTFKGGSEQFMRYSYEQANVKVIGAKAIRLVVKLHQDRVTGVSTLTSRSEHKLLCQASAKRNRALAGGLDAALAALEVPPPLNTTTGTATTAIGRKLELGAGMDVPPSLVVNTATATAKNAAAAQQQEDELPPPQVKFQNLYQNEAPMTREKMQGLRGPNGPKYNVLVTGAAGFVGMYTALELKRLGMNPVGYDIMTDYYSVELKKLRVSQLAQQGIPFVQGDVCDRQTLKQTIQAHNITRVVHLAAQAGVRYSLDHPMTYTRNNIDCFVHLLETLKELELIENDMPLVYASSSSVYGNNKKVPFQETDPVEDLASLYAMTKRSNELTAHTYWNLYNISSIGLRFFTVYGPYGRPDMAPWIFTDRISQNETIKVFNHGESQRDFTYVEDIVQGVVNALFVHTGRPEVVNLGNGRPIVLADFVRIVEQSLQTKANILNVGMQKGDVPMTYADISKARHLLGYHPSTPVEQGIQTFVEWFRKSDAHQYRMES